MDKPISIDQSINALRNKVINISFLIFAVIGLSNQIFVSYRAFLYGFDIVFYLQLIALIIFLITTFYRNYLSIYTKVLILSFVIFSLYISGAYKYGFLASSKIYLTIFPIYLSFVLPIRKVLAILVIFVFCFGFYGYLYSAGILIYKIDLFSYATNKYIWISDGLNLLLTSLGLLYIGMNYHGEIIDNYIQIDKQNKNLVDKEKKFRILFESSHDAIILIDNSKFFDCNKITFSLFKCEREFIIGKEPHEFSPEFQPDGQNSLEKANFLFSEVYKGNHQIFEWQHVRPNGELFDVSISLNLVDLGDKKYAQAVLRDITEKKKQEKELIDYKLHLERLVRARTLDLETTNEELLATNEELFLKNEKISEQKEELEITLQQLKDAQTHLLQSEKMASLGILTAGVAHEINNPLNFIMGGYVGLEKHFAENNQLDDPKIIQILNSIKTGVNRATNIVNSLNQFSRSRNTLDEICNIQEIIDNCLLMLNNQLKNRIEVIKDYKLQLPYIKGNVGKLHQVFVNILTNVSQSISGKGFITIKTTTLENTAIIEVIDSGCGISQENLNKITDPFFTTKEPGKGTGLGLSITYAIIQEHKGKLHFISELDKGTTVKITFPLN